MGSTRDFNGGIGLRGMGVYKDLMGVGGTLELIEGFDVADGGGASEARGNLSLRRGQAGAEEVSAASHLSSSMLCFAFVQLALLQGFGFSLLDWDYGRKVVIPCLPIELHRFC